MNAMELKVLSISIRLLTSLKNLLVRLLEVTQLHTLKFSMISENFLHLLRKLELKGLINLLSHLTSKAEDVRRVKEMELSVSR